MKLPGLLLALLPLISFGQSKLDILEGVDSAAVTTEVELVDRDVTIVGLDPGVSFTISYPDGTAMLTGQGDSLLVVDPSHPAGMVRAYPYRIERGVEIKTYQPPGASIYLKPKDEKP